jgi:hypothetical protein
MFHPHNARPDRYTPVSGHRVSHTETPFCDIDGHGYCRNQFHSHTGRVRHPRRWSIHRKA